MNAPASAELFTLPPGTKKVTITRDTRAPHTQLFTIQREDHTMGNLLCNAAQKHSSVTFCGYAVPHPLEPMFNLRIQTTKDTTPKEALLSAIQHSINEFSTIESSFRHQLESYYNEHPPPNIPHQY